MSTPAGNGVNRATLFIWLFAIASIWHHTSSSHEVYYYWFHFDLIQTPAVILATVTALLAACYPGSIKALLAFVFVNIAVIATRLPFAPTHVVMELFVFLSIFFSYLFLAIEKKRLDVDLQELYDVFSPLGRWLLIIMYFFGTFHKLNPGFLSLDSSCAIPYLRGLPIPDFLVEQVWVQWTAIYMTLFLEFTAMLLLFSSRTKYYGMLLGMPFHLLIGISAYGTLAHFSAFALTLHILFTPSNFSHLIAKDNSMPPWLRNKNTIQLITIAIVMLQFIFAYLGAWMLMNILFGLFGTLLIAAVLKYGSNKSKHSHYRLISRAGIINALPILFFIHCSGPYIGLNTAAVVEMFSGLRVEGGESNHYIIRKTLDPFNYHKHVLYIEEAKNDYLNYLKKEKLGILMFDFQRYLTVKEEPLFLPLKLKLNGEIHHINSFDAMNLFVDTYFFDQSWLERYYLIFREVDDYYPSACRH